MFRDDSPERAGRGAPEQDADPATAAAGEFTPPPPRAAPLESVGGTEAAAGPPGGQWVQAWREFRKRTGAMIAVCVIFLLVTSAIFAPLLANDRPLVYHGANRFEYAEAARSIRAMLSNAARAAAQIPTQLAGSLDALRQVQGVPEEFLADMQQAAEGSRTALPENLEHLQGRLESLVIERQEAGMSQSEEKRLATAYSQLEQAANGAQAYVIARGAIPAAFERMIALVVPEDGRKLADLKQRGAEAMSGIISVETANRLRDELADYPPDVVLFVGQWGFPAFASMDAAAVGFVVLNTLVILALAARLIIRRPLSRVALRRVAWSLGLLPLTAGIAWAILVPNRIDRTPYKRGIPAQETGQHEGVAPVLYSFSIWPPIPYSLDEVHLDAALARPAIFGTAAREADQPDDDDQLNLEMAPHWLGTDTIGRDTLARMLWGARVSLSVGILAVSIYVAIGIVVGAIAGYYRGWVDMILSRIIEVVLVFPAFFLILTVVAFLGPSFWNIMLVIGLTGWTRVARLARGEFLRLADQEFVVAGRALGYGPGRLIFRHILPNALAPVLVAATFGVAGAILIESALSFLGIGISIPTPSWGNILADGRNYKVMAPWLIYFPGMAIFITILCYNLAGEALRDALDPRLRGSR